MVYEEHYLKNNSPSEFYNFWNTLLCEEKGSKIKSREKGLDNLIELSRFQVEEKHIKQIHDPFLFTDKLLESKLTVLREDPPYISSLPSSINSPNRDPGLYLPPLNWLVTAETIGEYVLPIVEFIEEEQPDYIIACDRGGRPLGLAVASMYKKMHGRLPTVDGTLRFRRITKTNEEAVTEEHVRPLVEEMLTNRQYPKVLVLDDCIVYGGTKYLVQKIFNRMGEGRIQLTFGVLCGSGGNISGSSSLKWFDWEENGVVGVSYTANNCNAKIVKGESAKTWRRTMYDSVERMHLQNLEKGIKELRKAV